MNDDIYRTVEDLSDEDLGELQTHLEELKEELEVVIRATHDLPNDHVVHCLGPRWGIDSPEAELLADCYRQALALADEHGVTSIAFPAISTGAFGYPMEEATEVTLDTVLSQIDSLETVERIRFVLYSDRDRNLYEQKLDERL